MSTPLSTAVYWERRYAMGRNSGAGSEGAEGAYKAAIINELVKAFVIRSVLDVGCGEGTMAERIHVERYVGYDPSLAAVSRCRSRMPMREFTTTPPGAVFDATLSLDVIYHLTDDADYQAYLALLFARARHLVVVYGTNEESVGPPHVRHRRWLSDVPQPWRSVREITGSFKRAWVLTPGTR